MNTITSLTFKKIPMSDVASLAATDVTEFDWFEIFYEGTHTSSEGHKATYTANDLEQMAKTEPQKAPLVVGHPKTDSPAWGWAAAYKVEGARLLARADNVNVAFAKAVAAKQYPNRSVRLERTPEGDLRIAHIGFLGGAAPALEGMKWQFSGDSKESHTIEFSAAEPAATINKPEDKVELTQEQLDAQIKAAVTNALEGQKTEFNKQKTELEAEKQQLETDKVAAEEAKKSAEAHAAEADKKVKEQEFAAKTAEQKTWLAEQVKAGRLLPAQANLEGIPELFAELAQSDQTICFSKGGTEATANKFELLKNFVANGGASPLGPAYETVEFSQNSDLADAEQLHSKAVAYQKGQKDLGIHISISEAVDKVSGSSQ